MITDKNYYDVNNKGLSQSKIKRYEQDPNYMYRSYISGELEKKDTKAFLVGREVDSILTEMDKAQNTVLSIYPDFRKKEAREWKVDQEFAGKTVVTNKEYEQIMATAIAVQSTSIWKEIEKDYTMQEVIQIPQELGEHFDCLYGKLDAYKIDEEGICDLTDLKTSITVNQRQFFYKAKDLGYFKQLWMYSYLLMKKYPQINGFRYWFVVAEKSEPYRVALFRVDNALVENCEDDMLRLISDISQRIDWSKPDVKWSDAIPMEDHSEF